MGHQGDRILILCDSFVMSTVLKEYLQESFADVHFRRHQAMSVACEQLVELMPKVVLYAVSERMIPLKLSWDEK